jgi:hypothetical protein
MVPILNHVGQALKEKIRVVSFPTVNPSFHTGHSDFKWLFILIYYMWNCPIFLNLGEILD